MTRASVSCFLAAVIAAASAFAGRATTNQVDVPSSPRSLQAVKEASARLASRLTESGVELGAPICLRIFKQERVLEVWMRHPSGRYRLFASYPICNFSGTLGPKLKEGDRQAPEGFYVVPAAAMNPTSSYHLSFDLGYPNAYDRAHGRTGSELMVHGNCVSIGCYAMTDRSIEEIWTIADAALRHGQPGFQVQIYPFRMTAAALDRHRRDQWFPFWSDLKKGYDLFERWHVPPVVDVREGRYRFARP